MVETFHPTEFAIPPEITDALSLHVAAVSLIRKSLATDGETIKPAFLKRLIGHQTIIKNKDSGYNPNTKSGFATIPVEKGFEVEMGEELAKLLKSVTESESGALEIFIQHGRYVSLPPVSTISIYEVDDATENENDTGDDSGIRAVGDAFELRFETSVTGRKREIKGIWAIQLTNELVRFANQALEQKHKVTQQTS